MAADAGADVAAGAQARSEGLPGNVFSHPTTPQGWAMVAAGVVGMLVVANMIAMWLQRKRWLRISEKAEQLRKLRPKSRPPVPVTIVTGFLGSGKTTLLNHILKSPDHGKRIIVIENELGSVSIDHALLDENAEQDPDSGIIVLKNGCMCCAAEGPGNELERVLDKLLELADRDGFDYVVIETTGLADPAPVIQTFFRSAMMRTRYHLDSVVTVVDAKQISRHLQGNGFTACKKEAERQVAYADRILLNKVDLLLSADALDNVMGLIRGVNAAAPVIECEHSRVPLDKLLDIRAFDLHRVVSAEPEFMSFRPQHTPDVRSVSFSARGDVVLERLEKWLRDIVDANWQSLYRLKGMLCVRGDPRVFVVQGVHADLFGEFGEVRTADGRERMSHVVLIGLQLDEAALRAGFAACLADDAELLGDGDGDGAGHGHSHGHGHGDDSDDGSGGDNDGGRARNGRTVDLGRKGRAGSSKRSSSAVRHRRA